MHAAQKRKRLIVIIINFTVSELIARYMDTSEKRTAHARNFVVFTKKTIVDLPAFSKSLKLRPFVES